MKQFSKLLENYETKKYFKVKCEVELIISSDNKGEAECISDFDLSSIKSQSKFKIKSVSEIDKDEYKNIKK